MSRKGFTPEQIITLLWEAEVLLSQGIQVTPIPHMTPIKMLESHKPR